MKSVTAIVVAFMLLSAPASADEPPAESNESPTRREEPPANPAAPAGPTDPTGPPVPATPASPPAPPDPTDPTSARSDFAAIQKHLVVVKDGLESAEQAPGFSISAQGHIVTSAGELRDRPSYLVSTADGRVFSASKIKADEHTGVWILKLSDADHGLTGLPFAHTALQAAAPLHAVTFNPSGSERFTSVTGSVTQLVNTEQGQMIQHNALFSLASAGTPLLNRCYQAVGVNVLQKQGLFRRAVDPIQEGSAQSIAAAALGNLLASLNLSPLVADTECLSPEEEAQQKVEQAQQEQEALEEQARQAEAAKEQAQQQLAQAEAAKEQAQQEFEQIKAATGQTEQELAQATAAMERAQQELAQATATQDQTEQKLAQIKATQDQTEQKLEQAEADKERALAEAQRREEALKRVIEGAEQRQRQILLYGSIIGGLVLLGVVVLIRRKQKRLRTTEQEKQNIAGALDRAQSELSQAAEQDRLRGSAPDVFLEGKTPPIALKIPGASLVEQAGAVVGRSPAASTFVINHKQISRQHFRLTLVSHQIMIEDLGSTNGTSVDGVPLEPRQHLPVREGSRLTLGDLELTLHIGG